MARAPVALGVAAGGAIASWTAYDKRTCHPMRKRSNYADFVHDSRVRLLNLVLPPSTSLSLQEMRQFSGHRKEEKMYFGCRGWVYDASDSASFRGSYALWAGRDATYSLATMSLKPEDANRQDRWLDSQLSANELETLEGWETYFGEKYRRVARLKEYDQQNANGGCPLPPHMRGVC